MGALMGAALFSNLARGVLMLLLFVWITEGGKR